MPSLVLLSLVKTPFSRWWGLPSPDAFRMGSDIRSFFPGKLTPEQEVAKAVRAEADHQEVVRELEAAAAREQERSALKRGPGRPRKIRTFVRQAAPPATPATAARKVEVRRNWFNAPKLFDMITKAVCV